MSEELIKEFKKILKEEYLVGVSDIEALKYAESIVEYFALLEEMYLEKINN